MASVALKNLSSDKIHVGVAVLFGYAGKQISSEIHFNASELIKLEVLCSAAVLAILLAFMAKNQKNRQRKQRTERLSTINGSFSIPSFGFQ